MSKAKYTSIGGQALIEGIMMKGPEKTAMAVRRPDKEIEIKYLSSVPLSKKYKILGLPIIRGVVNFVQSMVEGYKALMQSAEISGFAEEEGEKPATGVMAAIMSIASVLAVILSVFLFIYLPALIFDGVNFLAGSSITQLASLFEGIIRLIILVCYMLAVSKMPDIKRVFMYHGAEHKTIFCFEAKLPLTVENARAQKRLHPRCGTSFLILMILVSILVSSTLSLIFPALRANRILWVAIKLLMIPLICGLGYELIKICGKYDNIVTRIISAPGMWLQKITTVEPTDDMLEIAIAAMNAVLPEGEVIPVPACCENNEAEAENE
ncbi:MAG: DUF1385 domain-containing protein [Clostridia bacterium]|nr:DUF1385 domain-containing protein [Clostridia bacterium]